MKWYENSHNPQAITSIFTVPPTLEMLRLSSVGISAKNHELTLTADLLEFPTKPPPRWHKLSDVAQVEVAFFAVSSLEISGWGTDGLISIQIDRNEKGQLTFVAHGQCLLRFDFAAFRIVGFSDYKRQ